MKIGIIGSGIVGRVLARAFFSEGHQVVLGTRDINKEELLKFKDENPSIGLGSFEETASHSDLVVLAVSGSVVLEAIDLAGKGNFIGKTVIDATNPIAKEPPVNGVLKFFTDYNSSLMEKIQETLPEAKLVKAFSCVGNAYMYKPDFNGITPTMFICGNDGEAKRTVTGILDRFGWETADMGMAESARAIEPLCILWCIPGILQGQWRHAFKLLKQ
ncbi:MAG: NAD(P)-binding domain-containing protein [Chitinophagaceae bacterium]|nr:NAD(P)-binding domain-containing protein [Chitinophagaceae bacterium]MBL0054869.1 NAD(P)-binding domain-containing protein [Chitinophagaceae bacterium]